MKKDEFRRLVFKSIDEQNLTYRELESMFKISFSTFSRIKQNREICVDSFVTLLSWARQQQMLSWNEVMRLIS